jgi:hypothetical protein
MLVVVVTYHQRYTAITNRVSAKRRNRQHHKDQRNETEQKAETHYPASVWVMYWSDERDINHLNQHTPRTTCRTG